MNATMQHDAAPGEASTALSPIRVSVVDSLEAISGGEQAWNRLVDASTYPNVFRRWEWVTTWWKWFGERRRLRVIQVLSGQDLLGLCPLYEATPHWRFPQRSRKLALIGAGGPTYPEYLGPIVHRDHAEATVCELSAWLTSSGLWDVIEFPDIPPDDAATVALAEALAKVRPVVQRPGETCPYLELPDSYEFLLGRLGGHGRQRERRQARKAQKFFRVELDLLDSVDRLREAFPRIIELSRSSRSLHRETSPFDEARYARFHREVIELFLSCGVTRIFLLRFDGTPVAFQYGYLYRRKYYDFQNGFDSSLKEYSPGAVLLQLIFQQLVAEGAKEFDFLRGGEAYKRQFADQERRTETTLVFRRRSISYVNDVFLLQCVKNVRAAFKKYLLPRKAGHNRVATPRSENGPTRNLSGERV